MRALTSLQARHARSGRFGSMLLKKGLVIVCEL
jgi:hypothetical protein